MQDDIEPVVGTWYQRVKAGEIFQVVAVDEESGLIETQHFDGDLEEIDLEAWYAEDLEVAEAPEDWTGPVDDVEKDDLGYTET